MTSFNENKLSKIMARRIIAPEDRANLLPFSTPIYCPDNNGVKASRVTIIDPNANTLFTSDDFISIGSQFTKGVNNKLVATGTPVVNDGIYTGSTTNFYKVTLVAKDDLRLIVNQDVTKGDILLTFAGSNITATESGKLDFVRIVINNDGDAASVTQSINNSISGSNPLNLVNLNVNLIGAESVDLSQSTLNDVPLYSLTISKQPNTIKNTVDIDLDKHLDLKYFIPTEVDLKTDVDLINFLKSDAAVSFKHVVSTEIHNQLEALVAGNLIPKITMADTLSDALGTAVSKLITDGTGQKFSIYKYNNGAPIEYINRNNQPNIDKVIDKQDEFMNYASIDDVQVPALYYFEKPTLILDNAKFEDFQKGLVGGTIKRYINDVFSVDTTADTMTNIGEGVFGTNDCFAVAFTQPSIKRKPSQDMFGDELYITIYYGVKLISKTNLMVFE